MIAPPVPTPDVGRRVCAFGLLPVARISWFGSKRSEYVCAAFRAK